MNLCLVRIKRSGIISAWGSYSNNTCRLTSQLVWVGSSQVYLAWPWQEEKFPSLSLVPSSIYSQNRWLWFRLQNIIPIIKRSHRASFFIYSPRSLVLVLPVFRRYNGSVCSCLLRCTSQGTFRPRLGAQMDSMAFRSSYGQEPRPELVCIISAVGSHSRNQKEVLKRKTYWSTVQFL